MILLKYHKKGLPLTWAKHIHFSFSSDAEETKMGFLMCLRKSARKREPSLAHKYRSCSSGIKNGSSLFISSRKTAAMNISCFCFRKAYLTKINWVSCLDPDAMGKTTQRARKNDKKAEFARDKELCENNSVKPFNFLVCFNTLYHYKESTWG